MFRSYHFQVEHFGLYRTHPSYFVYNYFRWLVCFTPILSLFLLLCIHLRQMISTAHTHFSVRSTCMTVRSLVISTEAIIIRLHLSVLQKIEKRMIIYNINHIDSNFMTLVHSMSQQMRNCFICFNAHISYRGLTRISYK